jgi:hypothetical protein
MIAPELTRQQLQDDERAAERAVIEAESVWLFAQATGIVTQITAAAETLAAARVASLAARQTMQEGLDAWMRYAAYQEAVAHADANGVPIPSVT